VAVQIYTLDRDWPSRELQPVDRTTLLHIAATLQARGCSATVFTRT
jgi:hypothetical protein